VNTKKPETANALVKLVQQKYPMPIEEIKAILMQLQEENKIRSVIEGLTLEGDLKREVAGNIKRLKEIKTYRGLRHMRNLPVHGQRTKSNARTKRGAKKTMGTGRKVAEKK